MVHPVQKENISGDPFLRIALVHHQPQSPEPVEEDDSMLLPDLKSWREDLEKRVEMARREQLQTQLGELQAQTSNPN